MAAIAMVNGATRQGFRSSGPGEPSGRSWAVFPPTWSDEDVREEWSGVMDPDGWSAGCAGHSFAYPLAIRRTSTRVLAVQFSGLDV